MNDQANNKILSKIMSGFQQLAQKTVDKYCTMPLQYKPGLYSIQWESSYRISGLLHELNIDAVQTLREIVRTGKNVDSKELRQQIDGVIHHALVQYIEQIFGADYPASEQPEWMVQIARRLRQNLHIAF